MSPKLKTYINDATDSYKRGEKHLLFVDFKEVQDEVKRNLVMAGIPEQEIFIVNADTVPSSDKRLKVSELYNEGKYKIVIGNKTMQEGMNFQMGTSAVKHLSLPYHPTALRQRNGRGLRRGNMANEVSIDYYMTRGTYDMSLQQMLERKANWESELWRGGSDTALNPEVFGGMNDPQELQIMLSDNPEAERLRVEASRKTQIDKQVDEWKSRAFSSFNQYQNVRIQYERLSAEEKESDKGKQIQQRIETSRNGLMADKYFDNKGLLEETEPVYIDAEKRMIIPQGHYFTRSDGNYRNHGLYKFVKIDPVNRNVVIQKVIKGTEPDPRFTYHEASPSNMGDMKTVDYGKLKEYFNYGMQTVSVPREEIIGNTIEGLDNIKHTLLLDADAILDNKEQILKKIRGGDDKDILVLDNNGDVVLTKTYFVSKTNKKGSGDNYSLDQIYLPVDKERWTKDALKMAYRAKLTKSKYKTGNTDEEIYVGNIWGWDRWQRMMPTKWKDEVKKELKIDEPTLTEGAEE